MFPSSAVMRVDQPFTINLDTAGAAHDHTVIRFVRGQAVSGLLGGCLDAPTSPLGFEVDTTSAAVVTYRFEEPGDYGVCFYVNATTNPPGLGTLPAHYLAWTSKIQVHYPVQSMSAPSMAVQSRKSLQLLVNQPLTMELQSAFIGAVTYALAGDLLLLVPHVNCSRAVNASDGGLVQADAATGQFYLGIQIMAPATYTLCHAYAYQFNYEVTLALTLTLTLTQVCQTTLPTIPWPHPSHHPWTPPFPPSLDIARRSAR